MTQKHPDSAAADVRPSDCER